MRFRFAVVALAALSLTGVGCSALLDLLGDIGLNQVTVRFINDTPFPIDIEAYYSEDDDALESLLTTFGEELNFTLNAGQTQTLQRSCADFGSFIIDRAEARVLGSLGPDTGTDVLRQNDEFDCGDVITFRFTGDLVTLNIQFE